MHQAATLYFFYSSFFSQYVWLWIRFFGTVSCLILFIKIEEQKNINKHSDWMTVDIKWHHFFVCFHRLSFMYVDKQRIFFSNFHSLEYISNSTSDFFLFCANENVNCNVNICVFITVRRHLYTKKNDVAYVAIMY